MPSNRQPSALRAEPYRRTRHVSAVGAAFAHEAYLKELAILREQLRIALSGIESKEGETAPDIAVRIKALRNQHSVEPDTQREVKVIAAEEPVTSRILRRAEKAPPGDPVNADSWQCRLAEQARARAERVRKPG